MLKSKWQPILVAMLVIAVPSLVSSSQNQENVNNENIIADNEPIDYKEIEPQIDPSYANKFFAIIINHLRSARQGVHYFNGGRRIEQQRERNSRQLSPVILVPGYGGSKLEARWRKQSSQFNCPLESDWRLVWCDPKYLIWRTRCLVENFKLEFDPQTNTTHNIAGVDIRVKTPDLLESVETITESSLLGRFDYFTSISTRLVENLGYSRDVNIRAAPFDFRKAPNELGEFFDKLLRQIELIFEKNGQRAVSLLCHSMGCNNLLYFLQRQKPQWKSKHVRRLISLAAPWAGSMNALRAVAVGDNLNLPLILDETVLNIVQRSLPSTMYLLPNQMAFGNQTLLSTFVYTNQQTHFTANDNDYKTFFDKLGHPNGYKMYLQTKDLLGSLEAPGVEVWCLYGHKTPTISQLEFQADFPNSSETIVMRDGDGTVSTLSLQYCREWSRQQEQPVHVRVFQADHLKILDDEDVIEEIEKILIDNNEKPNQLSVCGIDPNGTDNIIFDTRGKARVKPIRLNE